MLVHRAQGRHADTADAVLGSFYTEAVANAFLVTLNRSFPAVKRGFYCSGALELMSLGWPRREQLWDLVLAFGRLSLRSCLSATGASTKIPWSARWAIVTCRHARRWRAFLFTTGAGSALDLSLAAPARLHLSTCLRPSRMLQYVVSSGRDR